MEQNNNNRPKMPKFNMSWIYIMILLALVAFYFSGGDSIGGGMNKTATYDEFKAYVDSGYAQKVEVNKSDNVLKMFVKPEYVAVLTRWKSLSVLRKNKGSSRDNLTIRTVRTTVC